MGSLGESAQEQLCAMARVVMLYNTLATYTPINCWLSMLG
jgi:hypothetical protein